MVGAAGHDTSWDVFDKLFFLSIIPSIVLLTIYHNASISTAAKQLLRHSFIKSYIASGQIAIVTTELLLQEIKAVTGRERLKNTSLKKAL